MAIVLLLSLRAGRKNNSKNISLFFNLDVQKCRFSLSLSLQYEK